MDLHGRVSAASVELRAIPVQKHPQVGATQCAGLDSLPGADRRGMADRVPISKTLGRDPSGCDRLMLRRQAAPGSQQAFPAFRYEAPIGHVVPVVQKPLDACSMPFELVDGRMKLGTSPGLGLELEFDD
jgi:hypothetical protein